MEIKEKIIILGATKYSFMIHDMIESEHKYTILCHTVSKKMLINIIIFALKMIQS